jgi:hypothetical protein
LPAATLVHLRGVRDLWARIIAVDSALLGNPVVDLAVDDGVTWASGGILEHSIAHDDQRAHVLEHDPLHTLAALLHVFNVVLVNLILLLLLHLDLLAVSGKITPGLRQHHGETSLGIGKECDLIVQSDLQLLNM